MTDTPPPPRSEPAPDTLADRMAQRLGQIAEGGPSPAMTERDIQNLADYKRCLTRLSRLLEEEIDTIRNRDLDAVDALVTRKAGIVQVLERLQPMIDPFFDAALEDDPLLRAQVVTLGELVQSDLTLLRRMADAAQTIAQEHARILERHSLNGLYEKSGRKIGASRKPAAKIDESH